MTLYRPSSLRTGVRKRIFILFFCVIPPSQYPPSGFAGHLLINKEAYPIPILPVRIPFLNTVANPLLALWMTPYRPIVIQNGDKNALWERRKTEWWHRVKNLLHWWHLTGFLTTVADPSHPFRMTINVSLTTTANPLLLFRMTPNGNHMLRLLTHS